MQVPESIRITLRRAGLTPYDWRKISVAFESLPEPGAGIDASQIASLQAAAADLARAEQAKLLGSLPLDGEMSLSELQDAMIRALWSRWGSEGKVKFAARFSIARQTFYRMANSLGLTAPAPVSRARPKLETTAAIQAEIARLQQLLATLQGAEIAA